MLGMFNTRVIGLAEYRISADEPGVLTARYLTAGSRSVGSGRAHGGASDGPRALLAITASNTSMAQANSPVTSICRSSGPGKGIG